MGWYNSFSYKGFNLGMMLTARLGGLVVSNTQGVLDYYGVFKGFCGCSGCRWRMD